MYLSKIQLNALIAINARGSCDAAPELLEYLMQEGLIDTDLTGYLVTEKGNAAIRATNSARERLAQENKDSHFAEWERNNRV